MPEVLARVAGSAGLNYEETLNFLQSNRDTDTIIAEDELARRLGVKGVPCFIINRKYAVSGAQSPEVIVQVFDLAIQDKLDAVSEWFLSVTCQLQCRRFPVSS